MRYWRERLRGLDPGGMRLDPAGAYADPPAFSGEEVRRVLPETVVGAVNDLRRRGNSTDAAVMLSAYLLALRSQGAAEDCVVGVVVNNRGTAHARDIGYHVSTLPLRMTADLDAGFVKLARSAATELMTAVEHADVSFETLVPDLGSVRDDPLWWRSGLIRHVFNYRLRPPGSPGGNSAVDVPTGLTRFDLELIIERSADEFLMRLVYSTEVHDRAFAEALLERIQSVLAQAGDEPDRAVGDFELRTRAEIDLLERINDTAVEWTGPATVPGLVSQWAAATPTAVALLDGDRAYTYWELENAAAAIGRMLGGHDIGRGDVVGVAMPRGMSMAAAVLGVWSAGAAYLPLDPEHPAERLISQLDDANCRVLIGGHALPPRCRAGRLDLPADAAGTPRRPKPREDPDVAPGDLAYLIYTSGSTGRPKGVRVRHGNLANVVRDFARRLDACSETAMLWATTFTFDISALELCLPLVSGGRVVVAPDAARTNPPLLLELVENAHVTVVQATPTTWRLATAEVSGAFTGRTLLCGGEPLPPSLFRTLCAAGSRVLNVYGPTETTIWSTVAELSADDQRITVGRPIANTRVHIQDARGRCVPPEVIGELCVSGAGVADGYHNRPELAGRFAAGPDGEHCFRTGDLAKLRRDGRIELLGRRDRQIKLRGNRIELSEVEGVLEEHEEVRAAGVALRGDPSADGRLIAYVEAEDRPGLAAELWEHARTRLPAHSLPNRIAVLDALPQTLNGKLDFASLPADGTVEGAGTALLGTAYGSADEVEARLARVWSEVLHRPPADRDANFFLTGGTSILAARLAALVAAEFEVDLNLGTVFRAPTPAALAAYVRGQTERAVYR
ncbi:amino acid adenylation domain-containing protein [Nonomuraea sp. MG754425]|uniref:non-ribosomal peptide synthetase n=1 Tax=Nonomuraea sp. MG754425 TaxID=2570319 RepID=UPI0023513742|nr:amino acid adenylation domain-containing protein [Nonomuraea sp. MG754425]